MPLRASWMSLTLPPGRVRIALPPLVTCSLTPRGAGPWKAVGWPAATPPCPPAPAAPPAWNPPPAVVCEPVVVMCEPVVVWVPFAVGPCEVDAPVVVCDVPVAQCDAPVAPPAGLEAGAALGGGVFLLSAAALAMLTALSSPARTNAREPRLIVLRRSRIVILVPHSCSKPVPTRMRGRLTPRC